MVRCSTTAQRSDVRPRVLIADDDRILLDTLASVLSSHGYRIVGVAENGRYAVQLASRLRPDMVVLDDSMPVMSGLDAARRIVAGAHGTSVILLTEHEDDLIVQEALRIGVRGVLVKAQGLTDLLRRFATSVVGPSISARSTHAACSAPSLGHARTTGLN